MYEQVKLDSQQRQKMRVSRVLSYSGLIPFAVLSLTIVSAKIGLINIETDVVVRWFIDYSVVILAFLCGAFWAETLSGQIVGTSKPLLIYSNLFALSGFIALNVMPLIALACLTLGFHSIWRLEGYLKNMNPQSDMAKYIYMRKKLTIWVIGFHVFVFVVIGLF